MTVAHTKTRFKMEPMRRRDLFARGPWLTNAIQRTIPPESIVNGLQKKVAKVFDEFKVIGYYMY